MTRYTYTATSHTGAGCGHSHPTYAEANACRTPLRPCVTRVEAAEPAGWADKALFWLVLGAPLTAAWSVWFT